MGNGLRIIGLIVMALAIVSCGGGVYISNLILRSVAPQTPLGIQMRTSVVTSALIGAGIFIVGAVIFSAGTRRLEARRSLKKDKNQRVTCPSCAEEYSANRLRCPSCGEENELQSTPSRSRRGFLDMIPVLSDLSGPQRAMVLSGFSLLLLLSLAAFLLTVARR
jgi:hypothetical protein